MRATNEDTREVLLRALTDHRESYRRWMGPADIIQQTAMERRAEKPSRVGKLLQKLLRPKSKS